MEVSMWKVESLRFSFIGLSEEAGERFNSMLEITGIEAESVTNKPAQLLKIEQSPWNSGSLTAQFQPRRIDIIYNVPPAQEILSFPNGGEFLEVGRKLLELISPMAGEYASRVACAGVITLSVEDINDGYEELKRLLPFVTFSEDMREFSLHLNRPRNVGGIYYNELTRWSVATFKLFRFESSIKMIDDYPAETVVRLEFDFNNADHNAIPDGQDCCLIISNLLKRIDAVSERGA